MDAENKKDAVEALDVRTGSAAVAEDSQRMFRVLNFATLLKLHAKTISRLCAKRDPQEALRQLSVMQSDAAVLRIMLATWVEKSQPNVPAHPRE
jgi:ABC-type metal ion transport system substrate-binding protein